MIAAPPHATLAVSPAHVVLVPGDRRLVHVDATAGERLVTVTATVAGFALDPRGRPRLARAGYAAPWLTLRPRRLTLGRNGGMITVASRKPADARPGDHSAVVLLTASEATARGVLVRMRIGLVVSVRVPGRLVHRLVIREARVRRRGRRRVLDVWLANRGNVIEHLDRRSLHVLLVGRHRTVERLMPARRDLLPRSSGILSFSVPTRVHGEVLAQIELKHSVKRFHLRL